MRSLIAELYYNEPAIADIAVVIPYEKSTTRSCMNYVYMREKMKVAKIPVFTEEPDTYTKVAFIDPDVIFAEPDWYNMLSKQLDSYGTIQCFETVHCLDITYRICLTQQMSIAKNSNGTSGFGWAINKKTKDKQSFLPVLIYSMFRDVEPSVNIYNKFIVIE